MRTPVALTIGGVLSVLALAHARQTAPQRPATFKAGVDIVQVDVSVLDKNRQPVHGLAAGDFTILEDGKPQPVAGFFAVDLPDPPVAPVFAGKQVTWLRDVAPDIQTNDLAEGRLFVMFIDDALIPAEPKILTNAKQVARSIINKLGPADRMSIAFSQDGRQSQGFTSDQARLLGAVDRMQAGRATYTFGWDSIKSRMMIDDRDPDRYHNPHPLHDPDSAARDGSVRSLQMATEALLAAPTRRKALVYLSPGVPVNAALAANVTLTTGRTQSAREANVRLAGLLPDLFRELQRANVVVYPIDPTGPNGIAPFVSRTLATIQVMHEYTPDIVQPESQEPRVARCDNAHPGPAPDGEILFPCFVPEPTDLGHLIGRLNLDFLETVASNTGGRAIVNTENFEPGIAQMFVETGSYYLLGYRAPAGHKPGTMHRLQVTVNRPGVDVRTRSAYYTAEPAKTDPSKPDMAQTTKAIMGPLESSDLPLQVGLAPVAIPGKDEAAVTIVLGLQRAASAKPTSDSVHVETRAYTPDGDRRGIQLQDAFIAIRPSTTDENVSYEALSSINLKPGRYQLRIAAYSATNDAAGSVYADVEVPDFTKAPVSLSGVLISATPAVPAQPIDVLAKIVPVVPTAARVFQKLNQVTAFVRVYQGAPRSGSSLAAAVLAVRVTNERGDLLVEKSESFAADRFVGPARSVDYRFALPLSTLARGAYLLTFEASVGAATARRDVRFGVR